MRKGTESTMGRGAMPKGKKKTSKGAKRSRFNLSSKGEMALATVGVLVIAVVLFLIWSLLSPRLIPLDESKAKREKELSQQYEARWSALLKGGVLLKVTEERQDLYVDQEKWDALLPTEQAYAAAAICAHYKWRRCFIYDGSGTRLAWYTEGGGYQHVKPEERPK
jgi:hypothetical protein